MPELERINDPDVGLVDNHDRALATGVIVSGDVHISIADVQLVRLDLRLLLSSVETLLENAVP
jgi:hypothetical protein